MNNSKWQTIRKIQGLEIHHTESKTLQIKWGVAEFVVANEQ